LRAERVAARCIICGVTGIYVYGLRLRGRFICANCERSIVNSICNDYSYSLYINGLKKIWRCPGA